MSNSVTLRRSVLRKHDWVDERSCALHDAIAHKIRREPALLDVARMNLERWQRTCSEDVKPVFADWEAMIRDWPLETLLNFLTEKSERADRMRQSSPFSGILTAAERNRIFAEYEAL
jgi:hypothetical protein